MKNPSPRIRRTLLAVALAVSSFPALAFDATTRLTNVPIQDRDVGAALSQGLSQDFDRIFPAKNYGVRVIVDGLQIGNGQEVVYISVGLARRLPDGKHLQQHANYSYALVIPANENQSKKREDILKTLAQVANKFSQAVIENQSRVR